MMWNVGWLWSQCRGIRLHLDLICGTPRYFTFRCWHQCPSRLVTVILATLWNSIKQIKSAYVFDGEHRIALHAMQGNQASSRGVGEVSWFFSSCGRNLGYIFELQWGWSFKARVSSGMSGLLSSYERHVRNLLEAWWGNTDDSLGEAGDRGSLSSCHSDIGIPINFQQENFCWNFFPFFFLL